MTLPLALTVFSAALTAPSSAAQSAAQSAAPAATKATTAIKAIKAIKEKAASYDAPFAEITLPGPEGTSFVFCPIKVPGGNRPLDGYAFKMGDESGGFRTPRTGVVIGGGFVAGEDRLYYMGKYEVTAAQFKAVTGRECASQDDYPATGITYFDAMEFTDKLNRYLYEHAIKDLPRAAAFPGYVRLPSEEEWEFAARGGAAVESTVFEADTPYPEDDELARYEWFSGPDSSHNKLQKVGRLEPNALGLHDMLGNVQEMTMSLYRVEYYQGRSGGFTARGGHYLTEEDDMIAARRAEEPFYLGTADKGMKPNAKPTMGFRLVLAAPILTDNQAIKALTEAWKNHRAGVGATQPAALSVASTTLQEEVPAQEALKRLEHIREAIEKAGLVKQLKGDLDGTQAALLDMVKVRRKADEDSARVWVKIACERGMFLLQNVQRLEVLREMNADTPSEKIARRLEQIEYNVRSGTENYAEIMGELGKLPKDAVLSSFEIYHKDMQARSQKAISTPQPDGASAEASRAEAADLQNQAATATVTRAHFERYEKEKRYDAKGWVEDYLKEGHRQTGEAAGDKPN